MAVKAIAVDIDGTLTNDDKVVTPRTRAALMAAQERGVIVILCSGRPVQGLHALTGELELERHHGLAVAYNGAVAVDVATRETLFEQAMTAEESRAVLEHVRGFDVIPWVVEGERLYLEDAYHCMIEHRGAPMNIVKYERDACDLTVCEVRDLSELCDHPQCKILTAGTDTYLQAHHREMAAPFAGRLSCAFTADFYFEYMALGVNKGHALQLTLPRLGIAPDELVAFGDAQNDLEMIRFAGTGVAMGNATDEVKRAARMVTASNNEDGIAVALEQLL